MSYEPRSGRGASSGGHVLSVMPVSRRASAFADVLDGRLSSSAAGASVHSLASLAQRLKDLPAAGDAPTVAASLRADLLTAAAAHAAHPANVAPHAVPASAGSGHPGTGLPTGHLATAKMTALGSKALSLTLPGWAPLATGTLAAAIAATGVGVGASRAHPGDLLYGAKRVTEHLQASLAGGAQGKALTELGFAQARLHELTEVVGPGLLAPSTSKAVLTRVDALIHDWTSEVLPATATLLRSARAGSAEVAAALTRFTTAQRASLIALLPLVPDAQRSQLGGALLYLSTVDAAAASGGTAFLLPTVLPIPWSGPGGPTFVSPTAPASTRPTPGQSSGPTSRPTSGPVQLPSHLPTAPPLPGITLPPVPASPLPTSIPLPTLPPLFGSK